MGKIWQLGNTSVRSAMRLRDGLVALDQSGLEGAIRNKAGDLRFRRILGEAGVVGLKEDETNSVGRKWRSALEKMGFLYPDLTSAQYKKLSFRQEELGSADTITPAGKILIQAVTVPSMQECYLRALSVHLEPVEQTGFGLGELLPGSFRGRFSPLRLVLGILVRLEERGEEAVIKFYEMALVVQLVRNEEELNNLDLVIDKILKLRTEYEASKRKRALRGEIFEKAGTVNALRPQTFRDYADMNIRYLKATGMVRANGKGISLVSERRVLAAALAKEIIRRESDLDLYKALTSGAPLPTDNSDTAYAVIQDLMPEIRRYGITYNLLGRDLSTPAKINQIRYEMEELLSQKKEEEYAKNQAKVWQNILQYLEVIENNKKRYPDVSVPKEERPAYLEWTLWRAMLAVDSLVNKPYEVRRFKVDQDFLPVSTAPGNGPDLIAEFEDFILVIEVTLSESSRQEAMEGEPVRRHVADIMMARKDKPVYGLFLAARIDTNTAETFRIGVWYNKEDERLSLNIVPFTLSQFRKVFESIFTRGEIRAERIISIMEDCEKQKNAVGAPEWKKQITDEISRISIY